MCVRIHRELRTSFEAQETTCFNLLCILYFILSMGVTLYFILPLVVT